MPQLTRTSRPASRFKPVASEETAGLPNLAPSQLINQRTGELAGPLTPQSILTLQRSHGNQFVQRLLAEQRPAREPQKPAIQTINRTPEPKLAPAIPVIRRLPARPVSPRRPRIARFLAQPVLQRSAGYQIQRSRPLLGQTSAPGGVVQRGFLKTLKAILTSVGIGIGKAVLGPIYEFIQHFAIYKKSGNNVDVHWAKDFKKWQTDKGTDRYGPGGSVPLFLRMISQVVLKKAASYASWAALICGLIGLIPMAHAALGVSAAIGSIALAITMFKTAIDQVLNTWSGIYAWMSYLDLPKTGLTLTDPGVDKYLKAYAEYRKTRGELMDDGVKLGTSVLFGGLTSVAQGSNFGSGAEKAINPQAGFAKSLGSFGSSDATKFAQKLYSKEVGSAVTKEFTGNIGSWTGKGKLKPQNNPSFSNVGNKALKDSPNAQLLISNSLISTQEFKTRDGSDANFSGKRSDLPGPPGTSLKGMLGVMLNPLGSLIMFAAAAIKALSKLNSIMSTLKKLFKKAFSRNKKANDRGRQSEIAPPRLSVEVLEESGRNGSPVGTGTDSDQDDDSDDDSEMPTTRSRSNTITTPPPSPRNSVVQQPEPQKVQQDDKARGEPLNPSDLVEGENVADKNSGPLSSVQENMENLHDGSKDIKDDLTKSMEQAEELVGSKN